MNETTDRSCLVGLETQCYTSVSLLLTSAWASGFHRDTFGSYRQDDAVREAIVGS